jgi:hypothetical protein
VGVNDDTANALGLSLVVGACYGVVAFGIVLVLDLLNPTFAPGGDFVASATGGAVVAGALLWWRGAERPGVRTRNRSTLVGAVVGVLGPTLAFALNPSVYGSSPNVVDLLGGVIAAGVLGATGVASTYGAPVLVGALVGWSLGGWIGFLSE